MNKVLKIVLLLSCFGIVLFVMCDIKQSVYIPNNASKDSLYISYVFNSTTQIPKHYYRLISLSATNGYDTTYSDTMPECTIAKPFGSDYCGPVFFPKDTVSVDTVIKIVDNPFSLDTVFVFDSIKILKNLYIDTITFRWDTVSSYQSTHRPYITRKDTIAKYLAKTTEGLRQYICLHFYHFQNDSAIISLIGNPTWITIQWISNYMGFDECWFYPQCINGILKVQPCRMWIAKSYYNDCTRPMVVVAPDSSALDSVFSWKIVISNKYAQSDTMSVSTVVEPYPYWCK